MIGYRLTLEPSAAYPLRDVRLLLKQLLRGFGMRCVMIEVVNVAAVAADGWLSSTPNTFLVY